MADGQALAPAGGSGGPGGPGLEAEDLIAVQILTYTRSTEEHQGTGKTLVDPPHSPEGVELDESAGLLYACCKMDAQQCECLSRSHGRRGFAAIVRALQADEGTTVERLYLPGACLRLGDVSAGGPSSHVRTAGAADAHAAGEAADEVDDQGAPAAAGDWWGVPLGAGGRWWGDTLRDLSLSFNHIDDAGSLALALALGRADSVTRLDLSNNCIHSVGAAALATALISGAPALEDFSLGQNYIGNRGGVALAKLAFRSAALRALNVSGNLLGQSTGKAFAEVLRRNPPLTNLNLSQNSLGDAAACRFGPALSANTALLSLHLGGCGIGEGGFHALATGLLRNTTLTALDVEENALGGHLALPAMCLALRGAQQLRSLRAGDQSLGPLEVAGIACAVQDHPRFTDLCLSQSHVGVEGARALASLLATSTSILCLQLDGSPLTPCEMGLLGGGLASNRSLEHLTMIPSCVLHGDDSGRFHHHHALALAARDSPRCGGLELWGVPLAASAGALGLPPAAQKWSNERIMQEFWAAWRDKLVAFAMGLHPRLGGVSLSLVFCLDEHLLGLVGEAYWGRRPEQRWGPS